MVNNLDKKISKHAKDIIQRYTSGLFKDKALEFYGISTPPIKEIINVELPIVEVGESIADFVFLLEDDTYLHFEFQTTYNKSDLLRFASYDLRLFGRDGRNISTVVIYTADVEEVPTKLDIGSLAYNPNKVMMCDYDGNMIFTELEAKIKAEQNITDSDMINLIFLPLMRNTIPKDTLAVNSIKLAQTITDTTKRNTCIAAAFAFASKYLNENQAEKLLEVLKMTDLATMLITDERIEIAKNLLKENIPVNVISKSIGLDEPEIKRLQAELNNQ